MPVELLPSKKKQEKMCMKIFSRQVEALTLYCLVSVLLPGIVLFIFVRVDDILDSLTR